MFYCYLLLTLKYLVEFCMQSKFWNIVYVDLSLSVLTSQFLVPLPLCSLLPSTWIDELFEQ